MPLTRVKASMLEHDDRFDSLAEAMAEAMTYGGGAYVMQGGAVVARLGGAR